MLSNKILSGFLVLLIFFLISCSEKKKNPTLNYEDSNQVLLILNENFDKDISKVFIGKFDNQNEISVVAFAEKDDSLNWGIKFYHFYQKDDGIICNFETNVLEGTLRDIIIEKIKIKNMPFEMIYYNTSDYFMGSAGGEIFAYIINFNDKEIYSAHFVNDYDTPASLFISDNTDIYIRNFFISNFKKEFPKLKIVDKDIKLD